MQPQDDHIFVSSTIHDLVDLRAVLKLHIENMYLKPVMSEFADTCFEVGHEPTAVQSCLSGVEQCATYVLVLSHRYGTGCPSYQGKSVTRLEYEKAVELGRRKLIFLRRSLHADYKVWSLHNKPIDRKCKRLKLLSEIQQLQWIDDFIFGLVDNQPLYFIYDTVVDLLDNITNQLKSTSLIALFHKMNKDINAPLMNIKVIKASQNIPFLDLECLIENVGRSLALNVVMKTASDDKFISYGICGTNFRDTIILRYSGDGKYTSQSNEDLSILVEFMYDTIEGINIIESHEFYIFRKDHSKDYQRYLGKRLNLDQLEL